MACSFFFSFKWRQETSKPIYNPPVLIIILLSLSTFVLDVIFTYSTYFKLRSFPRLNEKEKIQVIGNDLYKGQLAIWISVLFCQFIKVL